METLKTEHVFRKIHHCRAYFNSLNGGTNVPPLPGLVPPLKCVPPPILCGGLGLNQWGNKFFLYMF